MSEIPDSLRTLNWADITAEAGETEIPPPGTYVCNVENAEWVTSSTNKPMLKLRTRIEQGPEANKVIFDQLVVTAGNPTALQIMRNKLTAICDGPDAWDLLAAGDLQGVENAVEESTVEIEIGHREWNGAMQVDVKRYKPHAGAPSQSTAPKAAGKAKAKASGAGTPPPPPPIGN